jgi:amidase
MLSLWVVRKKESELPRYLDSNSNGKRIGIEKMSKYKSFIACPSKTILIDLVIRSLGGTVVEIEYLDAINALGEAEFEVMQYL